MDIITSKYKNMLIYIFLSISHDLFDFCFLCGIMGNHVAAIVKRKGITMEKEGYLLQSVDNALKIMDLLSEHEEMGVADIHKATGQGRASIFRLLYTLEAGGYVTKSASAKYRLSNKFVYYGDLVVRRNNLVRMARPFMRKLRDECKQTTHLAILTEEGKSTFLYKEGTNNAIQMRSYIGLSMEAYITATGKVQLAQLSDQEIERMADGMNFVVYTENTIASKQALIREVQMIRQRGYAEDREESEIGLTCYAAPVFDYSGECVAGISVSGSTALMQRDHDAIIDHLIQTAHALSRELGYHGG